MRSVICALVLVSLLGCDSGGGQEGDTNDAGDAGITLSGKLVAGAQASAAPPPMPLSPAPAQGDLLVGYQLYCVTFATPPTAASGTADASGQVTLGIDARGVAFGCFILDADGESVATLIFTSGEERGQTITLTGDTELGSILVDLDNGVAQTDVTSTGAITGSGGLPCPLGTWVTPKPQPQCGDNGTVTFWFVQDASGEYRVSFTIGPGPLPHSGVCGYHSEAGIPATESGGVLTFSFLENPSCSEVFRTIIATPNADCTEITLESSFGPCESCTGGQCGCATGSLSCPETFTATRQ